MTASKLFIQPAQPEGHDASAAMARTIAEALSLRAPGARVAWRYTDGDDRVQFLGVIDGGAAAKKGNA